MPSIKKNIWGIGSAIILIGAFGMMWFAGSNTNVPSPNAIVKGDTEFTFTNDDYIRGKVDAKVTLVEFGDFQCPACASYAPIVDKVLSDNPDTLRIIYKDFPLRGIHPRAQISAQVARASGRQGKFWEMYDLLYQNQNSWINKQGTGEFEAYATKIGLNLEQFKNDINSQSVKDQVESDLKLGIDLGINGTPTFFLNGKHITNPRSVEELNALINEALNVAESITP